MGCRDVIHNVSLRLGENESVKFYEKDRFVGLDTITKFSLNAFKSDLQ
jgi:hypothetical protein